MNSNRKIEIMAIVNLTDDSYYAPSRCLDSDPVSSAMQRIRTLIAEGADIIDLGACSTRPGSEPVGAEEEWRRLKPVLEAVVSENPTVRISIDTYHSYVIRNAYDFLSSVLGEDSVRSILIVNDISAGEDDPQMLSLVGRLGLGYIAMHKRGDSKTMQSLTDYDDVVEEVKTYFDEFASKAASAGIRDWVLDPGFGFAKTVEQNYQILNDLDVIADKVSGTPRILVGVSRKSMIYKPLDLQPDDVLPATQAVHMAALMKGADILRVHDVKEARQTVRLYQFL
jgi:dihydropteroate synthase